jgi:nucleotide-binding universal stress UspA family protein
MSFALFLTIWLGVNLIFGAFAAFLANRWGRDPFGWLLVGAVLGPISLIILLAEHYRDRETTRPTIVGGPAGRHPQPSVLVAVDGSEMSNQAVEYVISRFGASLDAVTVVGVLPIERAEGAELEEGSPRKDLLEEDIEQHLGSACSMLHKAGISCTTVVRFGEPGEEILKLAAEEGAQLIVMGRRGRGKAATMLLGSVSNKVAKEAPCAVTVVG